jgi:hypothetical protein
MNLAHDLHAMRIIAPYYGAGERCGLHRYLDAEFVSRFQKDIRLLRQDGPQFSAWQEEERHSPFGTQPVLRLPLHRAFHIVCCEVVCDRLGQPALDPARVTSAGFVIRRVGGGREQAWMLEEGEALGWQDAPTGLRDPDLHRRLCASGVLHPRADSPAYTGEETHPLHVLNATDAAGKRHTLLFGYLPLGGSYFLRDTAGAFDAASQQQVQAAAGESLPWPYGYRKPLDTAWRPEHARPLDQGRPGKAMFELLRVLVNRFHLGEAGIAANEPLERLARQIGLYDEAAMPAALRGQSFNAATQTHYAGYRRSTLGAYLRESFAQGGDNPLVRWIVLQERAIDAAGGLDKLPQLDLLPAAPGSGHLGYSLLMLSADAQEFRELLGQRLRDQALAQAREIPLPKFTQTADDLYEAVPFVRALNDQGKEQIQWADARSRSIRFRVAAPFDPEASRPSMIQMPGLADLKRGLAKGAALITPADTFDLMNRLKLNKGASPDALPEGDSGPGLGLQWICSFSLPVITLVAMILLMIMISLLNIIFFWLPWVRICLPFPKLNK